MTTDPVYLALFTTSDDGETWELLATSSAAVACAGTAETTWPFSLVEIAGDSPMRLLPLLTLDDASWPSDYSALTTCMRGGTVAVDDGSFLVTYASEQDSSYAPALRFALVTSAASSEDVAALETRVSALESEEGEGSEESAADGEA